MATYTKETALYDTGAIATDIGAAGETASKYITTVDGGGIKVHPENNTTDYVQIDGDSLDIYSGGQEVASYGITSRIGKETESHINLSGNSISAIASSGNEYFSVSEDGGVYTDFTYVGASSHAINGADLTYLSPVANTTESRTKWNGLQDGDQFRLRFWITFEYLNNGQKKTHVLDGDTAFANKGTSKQLLQLTYGNKIVLKLNYNAGNSTNMQLIVNTAGTTTVNNTTYTFKRLQLFLGSNETITAPLYKFGAEMPESGGNYSFLMGKGTIAPQNYQLAIGKYNEANSDAAFIIGNGSEDADRSNVFNVTWNGEASLIGASGEIGFRAKNSTSGVEMFAGIGTSGTAHGVYSKTDGRWLINSNNGSMHIGGGTNEYLFQNLIVGEDTDVFSVSVGASTYADTTKTFTKSGYYPLGIVGWSMTGSGATACYIPRCYLSAKSAGSCTLTLRIRNAASSAATPNVLVTILWIKIL